MDKACRLRLRAKVKARARLRTEGDQTWLSVSVEERVDIYRALSVRAQIVNSDLLSGHAPNIFRDYIE